MKISKKYTLVVSTLLSSLLLSMIMSFVLVSINVGWNERFPLIWIRTYGIAFLVAFPSAFLLVGPLVRTIMTRITGPGR